MTTMVHTQPIKKTSISTRQPILKIIGLGGGGSNAVNRMIELDLKGAEFIAANTDMQALNQSLAPKKICLGMRTTRGLGAGGNPTTGETAAEESFQQMCEALRGADMVFLTAGMGGGTGTGSIAVAARAARAIGAVTVAVVTMPFSFEVGRRQRNAREGLSKLQPHADTLITVPNDQLLKIAPPNLPLDMAFRMADDVLRQGVQGISELITQPGLINVDFAHIRQVMQMGGGSMLSIGLGEGPNKAIHAVEHALHHPLLESIAIDDATAIVANFTGGSDMTFMELMEAMNYLQEQTHGRAEIIPGVITDERMQDRTQVILIITGLGATALDTHSASINVHAVPLTGRSAAPAPQPQPVNPQQQPEMAAVDLDIPAFMRRRLR